MTEPSVDIPTRVGQQLARRRDELDLTQEAVADRVGITAATVSATERGKTSISRRKRPGWEAALRLQPGSLGRAYRDGTDVEVLPRAVPTEQPRSADPGQLPYDPADVMEVHLWQSSAPEPIRRHLIREYRKKMAQLEAELADAEAQRRTA
jgi:transcriptional regulator with XRE-family HTH domain